MWSLSAFALYTVQVSVLYKWVEKTMVWYTAYIIFMERSLLKQTCFLSLPKALEAFDIHVSSCTSSFLLLTMEPRYWNLFNWVSTRPSICMSWSMSGGGWYITSVYLRLVFSPKAFAYFEKWMIISYTFWWLCSMKAMASANMSLYIRIFLILDTDLNWQALNRCTPSLLCIHTLQHQWRH